MAASSLQTQEHDSENYFLYKLCSSYAKAYLIDKRDNAGVKELQRLVDIPNHELTLEDFVQDPRALKVQEEEKEEFCGVK